jgi:predicted secreted protein
MAGNMQARDNLQMKSALNMNSPAGKYVRTFVIWFIALVIAYMVMAVPAFANFGDAATSIRTPVCQAYRVGRAVLLTAAVLAVIIGLAPMLWGEVKTKWIISSLVVCVFLGSTDYIGNIIGAFSGSGNAC